MKTAIVYYSAHHGNTRKLLDAIAESNNVTLIDVTKGKTMDISQYDRIGFASGIYYASFAKQLLAYTEEKLPNGKDVFYIATYGTKKPSYYRTISKIAESKGCKEIGRYGCLGFDTFGPFKLVGGIAKGHPTEDEINGAVRFYEGLK